MIRANDIRDALNRYHLTTLLRVALGCVFIFSAVTKGVDPYGTVLKMGEYFSAMGVPILAPVAPYATVALVALELWLGVALVVGAWIRLTLMATLVVSNLFTLLTLVLAVWNPVSDCGCFGDVVVLTNWQTFAKNVALVTTTLLVGWCYDIWNEPKKIADSVAGRWITPVVVVVGVALTVWSLVALPLVEKFPFGVGVNLREALEEESEAEMVKVVCRHKGDGHEEEFEADDSRWWNTDEWEFVRTVESAEGDSVEVRARDFMLYDEAGDATAEVVATEGTVSLICVQNLWKLSPEQQGRLRAEVLRGVERGERVVVAVATPLKTATAKLAKLGFPTDAIEIYNMDITTMQVVLRAPAGVVTIDGGVVTDKVSVYRLAEE